MTKKTEIEFEVSETVAYSRRNERFEAFCIECGSMSEMATPQIAAILTQSNEREIYRLIEAGDVHFVEHGRVLICMRSLVGVQTGTQASRLQKHWIEKKDE